MSHEITIAVFGGSKPKPRSDTYELAYQVGMEIARRGWTLCNGGYGGTMAASAKGAKQAGGRVVGITCDVWNRAGINPFLDHEVRTHDIHQRVRTLVDMSTAYIALPGGTGTLLELATVWELVNKKFLSGAPIVLLGDFWHPIADMIAQDDPRGAHCVYRANSPIEAAEYIACRLQNR